MFYKINVLQLGKTDFSKIYTIHEAVTWYFESDLEDSKLKSFDVVILDRNINDLERKQLFKLTKAYCLFILDDFVYEKNISWLIETKVGKMINKDKLNVLLKDEIIDYFGKPYGEKFSPVNLTVNDGFKGKVSYEGYNGLNLSGDFGSDFRQIAYWRNNIPVFKGQSIDFWLEYEKSNDVSIKLSIVQFVSGSLSTILNSWLFDEEDMKDIVYITNNKATGPVFVSILAKGKGDLKIIALHDRYSRRGKGNFLVGGQRAVTSKREEIFFYFDPGDKKPPLNVYFSGYKTQEGFEGYNMMRKMGSPFLLISESRLEGGAFYLGDEEYEKMMVDGIKYYLDKLGFSNKQMIMSGLSMGTFGAMYYACDFNPFAVVLGKPLCNLGDVANNERINRPYAFPTSLDVLYKQFGNLDDFDKLNKRFWDKFDKACFDDIKFVVSYMIEDDYDCNAYNDLLSHINKDSIEVYGKGIHGRHNDNTAGIVGWFVGQYYNLLNGFFNRRLK